jgi:(1->4)-alpha-D-glucan 1-alpha-D-glucosylmutase
VRARLDVLSECAAEWQRCFGRWRKLNQRHRATVKGRLAPDTNTEYLLYQTLIGIWPSPRAGRRRDDVPDRQWLERARERLEQYMLKAVKEAKTRTSWTDPDEAYENALKAFIAAVLTPDNDTPFLTDVAHFVSHIGDAGHWNALARVLVHLTSPGTPDTYQGDELWFFALVDPDNRRPVDYARRTELLAAAGRADLSTLEPSDERLKLGLLQRLLHTRRANAALFSRGSYLPLEVRGAHAGHLVAFARRDGDAAALVVAPRLMVSRLNDSGRPLDWEDTEIVVPDALSRGGLKSVLRDKEVPIRWDSGSIAASALLADFPLGLWLRS